VRLVCSSLLRFGALEFVAGVMALARVLGDDPRVIVEVWNKERCEAVSVMR
jgi:hypothetical protein